MELCGGHSPRDRPPTGGNEEEEDKAGELIDVLGYEGWGVDSGTVSDWKELRRYADEGALMSYRQERHVAELQSQFFDVLEKIGIEEPFPGASESAYW